jgi:hypothetical protein
VRRFLHLLLLLSKNRPSSKSLMRLCTDTQKNIATKWYFEIAPQNSATKQTVK